jgi:hypothetical protein
MMLHKMNIRIQIFYFSFVILGCGEIPTFKAIEWGRVLLHFKGRGKYRGEKSTDREVSANNPRS